MPLRCPNCKSYNTFNNKNINSNICYYCYIGFNTDLDKDIAPLQFSNVNILNYINSLDISIDMPNINGQILNLNYNDFNISEKKLESKFYSIAEYGKDILSIGIGSINYFDLNQIFKFKKIFNDNISIWILNPSINYLYENKTMTKYIYSIYSIYKIASEHNYDIHNFYKINLNSNLLELKFGESNNQSTNNEIQAYSDDEHHSKIFNPNFSI